MSAIFSVVYVGIKEWPNRPKRSGCYVVPDSHNIGNNIGLGAAVGKALKLVATKGHPHFAVLSSALCPRPFKPPAPSKRELCPRKLVLLIVNSSCGKTDTVSKLEKLSE
jgi:hypothetical protein